MVFEKFVVHLLDKYLSDYVENLDYKKLNIDMWNGNVVLENLSLKPNALADLHLPVMIKIGYLQKLTLQVPWKYLYTHPTKVTIDGVYIVVIPKIEVEYDAQQEENDRYKAKMKEVDRIEKLRKDKEDLENQKQSEETNDTFTARMQLQIIQNLELSIHNIHIVYEDRTTKPDHPFAFGITLNSITFQTTNKEWIPTVMTENTPFNYKLGKLNALSIYWNTDIKPHSNELIETLRTKIAVSNKRPSADMSYIFRPFNVEAKLIMTLKPRQQNFEKPMFHITIDLENMSLHLNRSQYLDVLDLLEYQDHITAKLKYIKYRPKIFRNSKEKWKFAYTAIVNESIKRRLDCYKWRNIQIHSKYCKEYRAIYFQVLIGKITDEQKQRAEALEKQLDVFNLTYIRHRAQLEAKKKKEQEPPTFLKSVANWWNGKSNTVDPELDLEKIMSDEEKKKFYQTIGYEGEDTSTLTYPEEYVDIDLTIRLLVFDLNIWSKINANDQEFQLITQASLPNTELEFRRRPATSSALFLVSLGSFQVFGSPNQLNETPPLLIQSITSTNSKLFQAEFAINPAGKDSGYRLKSISQSLEIKYHALTIDKLIQCFQNDSRHDLKGVKQVAYATYMDMKNRSVVLIKQNVERAKVLDIYIDLQSSYFLLPENGLYYDGCSVLCLDMGHLVFQQTKEQIIDHYTQFRLELKNLQLLYANKNENWRLALREQNTRLHLIKPITLYTDIFKCLYVDQKQFPLWKISGKIPSISMRVSDMRLFQITQHLQSYPFPQSQSTDDIQTTSWTATTTELTSETLAILTEKEETENDFTQMEGSFELSKIDLLLEEEKDTKEYPFLHISLVSMCAQAFLKTFDIEFQASLDDLIILHEQFITKDNHHLRFLAAQNDIQSKKLVAIHVLHTSSSNPLFSSSKYGGLENKIRIHLSKFVMNLQLEALLSIMRFQDNFMQKWPKEQTIIERKPQEHLEKTPDQNSLSSTITMEIEANLEEFRIVLATIHTSMFDIYVQGVKAHIRHTFKETKINLILTDFCLLDPNIEARYPKIISQQIGGHELLSMSIVLYNYPKKHVKALADVDCDIKIHFTKANIILIYKHINQLMEFMDALNISQAVLELASNQVDAVYEQVQKLQKQAFKLRLDAIFNAPNILIPINASSDEALFLDLGELTLQTKFIDDPEKLLVEQQGVTMANVLASRVRVNKQNEIQSEINLLECAKLQMDINRLLYPEKVKSKPNISMKMQWDFIHFQLAKDDYLCAMKILTENFGDEKSTNVNREQYRYRQEHQKREEEDLRNAAMKKQTEWQVGEILEKIRVHAEIKSVALTLYVGGSNLTDRHVRHQENSKLANIAIETLEFVFRQSSDSSYKMTTRVKNFLCDDLRKTHQTDAVIHVMDRHYTVDPNACMLIVSLEHKPKDQADTVAKRQVYMQLESLYVCLKIDYLMMLKDFFMEDLPAVENNKSTNQISESDHSRTSPTDIDIETRVDIRIKNPEILVLEDQRNLNSNCLVLNLALTMRMFQIGNNIQITGEMDNLTIYSSNLTELKTSKIKYRILQPANVTLVVVLNSGAQKIEVQIPNIIMSIAPAAVRTLLGVMNSLGQRQLSIEPQKFDIQTMFNDKSFTEGNFWFLKEEDGEDTPAIKPKEIEKIVFQQFILSSKTIEIKLDLDFGSRTKSVAAMCFSNWTVNLLDWSNQMNLSSAMAIEAALYNEHTLAWEPFIEPVLDKNGSCRSPWNINFSIKPILPATRMNNQSKAVASLDANQLISFRTDNYLNITITKTGFNLMNHLFNLSEDLYNQRLPESKDNQSMLSLINATGKNIFLSNLHGLEFTNNPLWTSTVLESNEPIPLTASAERSSSAHRLSVMEEQTSKNRQEFSIQINDTTKLISINRTWQRIYSLSSSSSAQILCDTQVHHNRRRVILSSIVKIRNDTIFPMLILDLDWISGKPDYRIETNEDFYVPMDLLEQNSSSSILITVDDKDQSGAFGDVLAFDWKTSNIQEEKLQLKNGQIAHLIMHKEMKKAYAENTDQLDRVSYCIYIHSAIQLTNLLPIDLQCWIDSAEQIALQPSQVRSITSGNKNSVLQFIIASYHEQKWISDPVDLKAKQKHDANDRIVTLRHGERNLRLILHVEIYHQSAHLTLFAPFWIVNHTNLQLEFRIGNERMLIGNTDRTFLICPEKYKNDAKEKGEIRLNQANIDWSEKFSLDVIKSIGMASCKGTNDKTYMICVDITTSSFGLTKIISFSPAMVVINQTSLALEVVETSMRQEQNKWLRIEPDGIIPFWPQNAKDNVMYVRYVHNRNTSRAFSMNKKHQTLLYMNDKERIVIFVEVIATDFDGVRVIFSDYKSGDAPVLLVNHTKDSLITFVQKDEKEVHYLVPKHFVYYTWMDPLKSREITVACNEKPKLIKLYPHRGVLDMNTRHGSLGYVVFIDGVQTVLLLTDNEQIIDMTLNIPSSTHSITRCFQIGLPNVGLSIVNDITREELIYISLNKSKVQWVQMRKSRRKPFPFDIQLRLEEIYQTEPNDQTKYKINSFREVTFHGQTAELITEKGERVIAKRQSLYGLWIEYTWSMANAALYACINRVQIDNQLDHTSFPSMLYPVLPKIAESNIAEKPFIELSVYEKKTAQSNIMHFQYCKLLIQEFAVRIEKGLILAFLAFFKEEKNSMTSLVDMNTDLECIHRSLQSIVKAQTDFASDEAQMYFDSIHLSPLQIHVSFSMHGSKSNEMLYPVVGFLLKTLNVAEVQDAILRLGFYERSMNRFTVTKLKNEVLAHYQNQFLKQIHVLVLGLDVLGNPLGIIRGLAEGVESLFYEPYKGAIEGPLEFAEGVATGVLTFVGSTVGTTVGALSKITGVIGQSLATLTFDEEYQNSRSRRKEPAGNVVAGIASGGKNVAKGFFHGITGVVTKPIVGAINGGVVGFVTGVGQGIVGVAAKPVGAILDATSTSLDAIKRTATQEQIVRRVRYPRHVGRDGIVRPYIPHEAMGLYILNRLEREKTDTYVAHITCTDSPPSWLMATSKQILFVIEISFLGVYKVDWTINYADIQKKPMVLPDTQVIQILVRSTTHQSFGKLVKYRNINDAHYFIDKMTNTMHSIGL